MRKAGYIFTVAWEALFILNFIFWQVLLYWPLKFLFARESRWRASMRLQRFWAGWLRVTMGVRTVVKYETPLDRDGVYIFAPNHTSFLDILVAYKFIPCYYHFMAKGELAKVPLFRIMFWKTHIPFERNSKTGSGMAYKRAGGDLQKGYSILVYPEGTQNAKKGKLLPFKNGAFKMSVENNVPVVPVTCYNNLEVMPHQSRLFKLSPGGPGTVFIDVGAPLYPADYGYDAAVISEKVRTIVQENLDRFYENRQRKR